MAKWNANWREVNGGPVYLRTIPASQTPDGRQPQLPLLLLHGLGCTGIAWGPSLKLLKLAHLRSAVLVPDLPGHGRTPKPTNAMSMADYADWCARFLDAFHLPKAHLIGNSMGCQIAMAMAAHHPERVGGMVLQGPTLGTQLMPAWRYIIGLLLDSAQEPPTYNALLAVMYLQMGVPFYIATTREMLKDDPLRYAAQIHAPTLIVRGGKDAIIPDRAARKLALRLPDALYMPLDSAAHAIEFSAPELFVPTALAYLRRAEIRISSNRNQEIV